MAMKSDSSATCEHAINYLPASYYDSFITSSAKSAKPSPIHALLPLEGTPNILSLLAGHPSPSNFRIENIDLNVNSPSNAEEKQTISINGPLLVEGLQYGRTAGMPKLLDWLYGLQERVHGRKKDLSDSSDSWRLSVGCGSQDHLFKAIHAMINPGDYVLVEVPVYAGIIPIFDGANCNIVEVQTDANGIVAESLRSILESWPVERAKPKALYTVPFGCNPTGVSAPIERRKEVLHLAREHNFIIFEDDPYFFTYYGSASDMRSPSYFALELDMPEIGRVLRFDSFSKVLSGGLRLGFVSGPKAIIDAIDRLTSASNLQPPSITQAMLLALFETWGYEGFQAHVDSVSSFYRAKRDVFEKAMDKHLKGLVEWTRPDAAFYFWIKLLSRAEDVCDDTEPDSEPIIQKAFQKGVLALPGSMFMPVSGKKSPHIRVCFSLIPEVKMDEAVRRLAEAIQDANSGGKAPL